MKPLLALCGAMALAACTTMGTGTGSVSPGGEPVTFAWKTKGGGTTGTMSATLADGEIFSGPYVQATSEARSADFEPLWHGWRHGWNDWPEVATIYSGRVMANLQAADGQRMRCRFTLNQPGVGMTGGGQGQCQLASGRTVDAVFPRT